MYMSVSGTVQTVSLLQLAPDARDECATVKQGERERKREKEQSLVKRQRVNKASLHKQANCRLSLTVTAAAAADCHMRQSPSAAYNSTAVMVVRDVIRFCESD